MESSSLIDARSKQLRQQWHEQSISGLAAAFVRSRAARRGSNSGAGASLRARALRDVFAAHVSYSIIVLLLLQLYRQLHLHQMASQTLQRTPRRMT
jgi:hypothetical protein